MPPKPEHLRRTIFLSLRKTDLATAEAHLATRNSEVESQSSAAQQAKSERRQREEAAMSKVALTGFAAEHTQNSPDRRQLAH